MAGYMIALMGSVAFIPQIRIILKSKNGEGLNLVMFTIVDFVTALISAYCIKSGQLDYIKSLILYINLLDLK